MSSTFGTLFRISTFGESHCKGVGVVIDGCSPGLPLSEQDIQPQLDRRRPGQSSLTTDRAEADLVTIISGTENSRTLGTPILLQVANRDQRPDDYSEMADVPRPSHADYTYQVKYGVRDYRGGGRSSARETAARVAAGALAKLLLANFGVNIQAYVSQVGGMKLDKSYTELDLTQTENNAVRCPDPEIAEQMFAYIDDVRKKGDSIGGVVNCVIKGAPAGWGEPVFDKLHAELGKAMLSINAVKGFEYGSGFDGVAMLGSEHNDAFFMDEKGDVHTRSNHSGGIQGGISNGEDIYFRVAFKPVATIMQDQESVDEKGDIAIVQGKGRHDPCVVPRAVPIVEAMAALVLADFYLRNKASKL